MPPEDKNGQKNYISPSFYRIMFNASIYKRSEGLSGLSTV